MSFKITKVILGGLFRVLIRLEVKGKENVPQSGPVIACCNHLHMIDPVLHILSILPRDSIFMAKEELFRFWPFPLPAILMRIAEAFPVRRRGIPRAGEEALQRAEKVLAEGLVLGIYPEGKRSQTGRLKTAYHGTASIALRSGAPIVPVSICGTEKLTGVGWLCRPKVNINFGQPFTLPAVEGELTTSKLTPSTDYIMKQLAAILPPEYQGKYKDQV